MAQRQHTWVNLLSEGRRNKNQSKGWQNLKRVNLTSYPPERVDDTANVHMSRNTDSLVSALTNWSSKCWTLTGNEEIIVAQFCFVLLLPQPWESWLTTLGIFFKNQGVGWGDLISKVSLSPCVLILWPKPMLSVSWFSSVCKRLLPGPAPWLASRWWPQDWCGTPWGPGGRRVCEEEEETGTFLTLFTHILEGPSEDSRGRAWDPEKVPLYQRGSQERPHRAVVSPHSTFVLGSNKSDSTEEKEMNSCH